MGWLTKDRDFYKQFFTMLFFIAMQNVIVYSVNLADNIMLGAYSETALSGVALVNQIQFLLQMIIGGVGEGVVVLTAQYWGQRNMGPIKRITNVGLYVSLAIGFVFLLAALLFPAPILGLLTNDKAVIGEGLKYLEIICYSYVFFCATTVLVAALRSVENVRIGMVISLSTLVVNVFLNYVLIFGHWGFPRLGTAGAAIATLIARIVEFGIVAVYVGCMEKKLRYRLCDLFKLDRLLAADYFRVATPVILSGSIWGLAMGVQTAILGRLGSAAIAANAIASSVFSIISVISYGGSSAASVLTGKTVGAGNTGKLREYVSTMQVLFLLIGLVSGAALLLVKDAILGFYAVSQEAMALANQFMLVLSVTVVGTSYQVACLTGIVRAGGNTKFVLYNDLIFMWLLVLPLSALCAFVWNAPPLIVFICLKCDQVLKCFVAVYEVNSYHWVRKLTRESA